MYNINNVCPNEDCDMNCGYDVHKSKDSTSNENSDSPNVCISCEG